MTINLSDYSKTAAQRGWGAGWPSCSGAAGNLVIVSADRSGVRVSVHKRIARLVDMLMDETERRGYLMKSGQTGAYNCRAIAGTKTPSNHSWGLAVDVNWQDNPFTTNLKANHIPAWMPPLWNRYGFAWGGNYSGKRDFMHFEFMGTPADADAMTALALKELLGTPPAPPPEDDMTPAQEALLKECNSYLKAIYEQLAGSGATLGKFTGWKPFPGGSDPAKPLTAVDFLRTLDVLLHDTRDALAGGEVAAGGIEQFADLIADRLAARAPK